LIEISHYIENAPVDTAQISAVELAPDTENGEDAEPGAFANILAGLLRNHEAENSQIPDDGSADAVLLAGNGEISTEFEEEGEALGQLKGLKAGKNQNKTVKPGLEGEELPPALFSEPNQNILLGPQLLVTRPDDAGEDIRAVSIDDDAPIEAAGDLFTGTELSDIEGIALSLSEAVEGDDEAVRTGRKNQAKADSPNTEDTLFFEEIAKSRGAKSDASFGSNGSQEEASLKNADGKKGRLEEVRGRERRERPNVEVRDLRTSSDDLRPESGLRFDAERPHGEAREVTLELRLTEPGRNAPSETGWEARSSQAFEDLLARELHQNFNNDIVRHASMILRDEGRGTIRLALRPESLGNVKIRLEMAENKITGHIVVESEEALRAFEKEIHSLEQAFKDSGFQGANLEMSLASDGRGAGEAADQFRQGREFLSGFTAASMYEDQEWAESSLVEAPGLYQHGQSTINMLA
jgi:hypothetical protein